MAVNARQHVWYCEINRAPGAPLSSAYLVNVMHIGSLDELDEWYRRSKKCVGGRDGSRRNRFASTASGRGSTSYRHSSLFRIRGICPSTSVRKNYTMGLRISRMINKHDKPTNVLLTAQSRSLHKADHCTMYRQHLMFGIAAWRSCKCTGRLHLWKDRSSFKRITTRF